MKRALVIAVPLLGLLAIAIAQQLPSRNFNHDTTSFPLQGAHKKVACESCHKMEGGARKWKGLRAKSLTSESKRSPKARS